MDTARSFFRTVGKLEGLPVIAVLIIVFGAFRITAPDVFSRPAIYMAFLQTVSPQLVCALGLTFVITAGEIDLSFPAIVAFGGLLFAWAYRTIDSPMAPWIGLFLALAGGGLVGYINGLLVARVGVPSIMATLASRFFWYGVTVLLAGGESWTIREIRGSFFHSLFVGRLELGNGFNIPVQAFWVLGLAIFLWFFLNRHKFGEAVMFIGDNADVARVMGINVEATKVRLFTMNGVLAGFAALLLTLDISVFFPTQGDSYMLIALAAVFIGGTSIAGGYGSIVGTVFGAYIFGSLQPGIVASRVSGYWVQVIQGAVMAASVALNIILEKGSIPAFIKRLRQWTGISGPTAAGELPRRDDAALG